MPDFTLSRFRFTIKLLAAGPLPPFKGSTIRGAVGTALHDMACKQPRGRCDGCEQLGSCIYIRLFKPDQVPGKSIPACYVIDPPHSKQTYFRAGDALTFTLTLFGWASEYIGAWIEAVKLCGGHYGLGAARLKFKICSVESLPPNGEAALVWKDGGFCSDQVVMPVTFSPLCGQATGNGAPVSVKMLTPFKFKDQGSVASILNARGFLSALVRRVKSLTQFYQEADSSFDDFSAAIAAVVLEDPYLHWVVLERASRTQPSSVNLGGFVGSFSLRHVSPGLHDLLQLGELTHIGKNTVCGCGKYRVGWK